jgi:hypothetical protein
MTYGHSIRIGGRAVPIFPTAIPAQWQEAARAKGFRIAARIVDRYHVALCCDTCGDLTKTRAFVLMSHQPTCAPCLERRLAATAQAAGLTLVTRCPKDRHYAHYLAECGHEQRRQFGFVERVARGEVELRCDRCFQARDATDAAERGWQLIGPDPAGRADYRFYRHVAGCGAEQPVARVNVQTGRFTCHGCGEGWLSAPSTIYLMQLTLPDGTDLVKLGFSRDAHSRLFHQLLRDRAISARVARVVPMPSGLTALRREKFLHKILAAELPQARVPTQIFAGALKIKSEIYWPTAAERIHALLDAEAARLATRQIRRPAASHAIRPRER